MGATGSGKSTFISLLADQDVEVSHGLGSRKFLLVITCTNTNINGLLLFDWSLVNKIDD